MRCLDVCVMELLVLCLLVVAVDTSFLSSNEDVDDAKRIKRAACNPGTWCPYGGRQYVFVWDPRQWAYAQLYCQALGGTLAVVQNRALNDFLRSLSWRMDAWIGFSDAQYVSTVSDSTDGVWLWVNSERVRFTNWCKGEPNNYGGKQHCAVTNYNGENCWDDHDCALSRPYFCERKPPQT
ncbi:perlucin-like [Eucyclogobius newberryi]|uniref:perlucin-like n=1 Tax=Eucyclogobius newberryi TaxID=166745 RepID=UPI003B5A5183